MPVEMADSGFTSKQLRIQHENQSYSLTKMQQSPSIPEAMHLTIVTEE
jgi:pyruvate/2-oxoacid:ferredoxin oxidoreductase beta subunit